MLRRRQIAEPEPPVGPGKEFGVDGVGYTSQSYPITDFLDAISQGMLWEQQCNDNSNLLATLAGSLGIGVTPLWFAQKWPIPVDAGIDESLPDATYYPAGSEDEKIQRFRFHQVDVYMGAIFDPSTSKTLRGQPNAGTNLDAYYTDVFPPFAGEAATPNLKQNVTIITIK